MTLGVLTEYELNGKKYSSYILGTDMESIFNAAKLRGIGETVASSLMEIETIPDYGSLSDEDFINRLPEILHTACFISTVALNARTLSVQDVLGDEGIIHEISHFIADIEGCNKKPLNCMRGLIKNLQKKAVGFYEPV